MQVNELLYNGKKLCYRVSGDGPVLMFVHGFGEDGEIWKNQFSLFPRHKLLIPDLPGSGRSEAIEDMSMEGLADAMQAIVAQEGGNSSVVMIGHSMGGYITLAYAEKYAARLRAFGLFHSTAFADSDEKKETRRKGIRFIEEHGATEFLKTATPNLYSPQSQEQHPEWIEAHLRLTHNFSGPTLVNYYKGMIERPDRTAILKESKIPVLFVMGQYDTAVPLQDGLAQCYLPQLAYIHILDHSGHMGMIEEESLANQILLQFVNAIENTA